MSTKTIFLKSLTRTPETDPSDSLHFERGVNVIVGKPNSGKSQWMRMLDYLMGDVDKPSDAFDPTLAEKYETIKGIFEIDGEELVLERRWKEKGNQGKVFVNGMPLVSQDAVFSDFWLDKLAIPRVNYPTGDPYRPGAWRRLTWRSLLRHVYRKQDSWTDIAAQQPPSEQHACLMLFTGLADALYSKEYGDLVELQKEITKIANKKEQFLGMLNELSHELLSHAEAGLEITPEAIQVAQEAIDTESHKLQKQREEVVLAVIAETDDVSSTGEIERLSAKYEELQELRASLLESEREHRQRQGELEGYRKKLDDEIAKFGRAKGARSIFEGLHVTQCPACQRAVQRRDLPEGACYVCNQTGPKTARELESSKQRVEFELEQLIMEDSEASQLLDAVIDKAEALVKEIRRTDEELRRIQVCCFPTEG